MWLESLKAAGEGLTGIGSPNRVVPRTRKPNTFFFADDGETPNNPNFPMILYRSPVQLAGYDPAAVFEILFAEHGWGKSWRDGVYSFNHFHTATHEVLGIARGFARIRFGGAKGRVILVRAGDVIVQPAGNGHRRLSQSRNLLVVGAYPLTRGGGKYDEPKPGEVDHEAAVASIAATPPPQSDPVYGRNGAVTRLWNRKRSSSRAD